MTRSDGVRGQQRCGDATLPSLPLAAWPSPAPSLDLPNTRDKLRGARTSTQVLETSGTVATTGYHRRSPSKPPLVSFIALLGSVVMLPELPCRADQAVNSPAPQNDCPNTNAVPNSDRSGRACRATQHLQSSRWSRSS